MKIAAAAYRPEWHPDWASLAAKVEAWVKEAALEGAELLLFPEYGGCEAALVGEPSDASPQEWAKRMGTVAADWLLLHVELAQKYGVHILVGSLCDKDINGYVNRAYLVSSDGAAVSQDKLILTPYERNQMQIQAGREIKVFDTALGKIGILICYDSEFPVQARAMTEAGAEMILVPSATDFPAGQTRVRQSCRARAIENQCLIIQSPVLGPVPACDVLDQGTGRVGFFCPPDHGLPSNGIIAQGDTDKAAWVYAEVDPKAISAPRQTGQVGNFAHWIEQDERVARVKSETLR